MVSPRNVNESLMTQPNVTILPSTGAVPTKNRPVSQMFAINGSNLFAACPLSIEPKYISRAPYLAKYISNTYSPEVRVGWQITNAAKLSNFSNNSTGDVVFY